MLFSNYIKCSVHNSLSLSLLSVSTMLRSTKSMRMVNGLKSKCLQNSLRSLIHQTILME